MLNWSLLSLVMNPFTVEAILFMAFLCIVIVIVYSVLSRQTLNVTPVNVDAPRVALDETILNLTRTCAGIVNSSIKLPAYWEAETELWFCAAEAGTVHCRV